MLIHHWRIFTKLFHGRNRLSGECKVWCFIFLSDIHIDRKTEDDISQSKVEEATSIQKI